MSIIVDNRERHIIEELTKLGVSYTVEQLDIGDFHIKMGDKVVAIWERKTYGDLASSIKDSRYREQKHRLVSSEVLIKGYILEGNYPSCKVKFQGLHEGTIDSIIMGLTVRDGFKLLYSIGLEHTAKILAKMLSKFPEYDIQQDPDDHYCSAVVQSGISTVKKENYTPEICYLGQLSQIPQVSYITAKAISGNYPNMRSLLSLLETGRGVSALSNIMVNDRRLGKPAAERIKLYLSGTSEPTHIPTSSVTPEPKITLTKPSLETLLQSDQTGKPNTILTLNTIHIPTLKVTPKITIKQK